MRQSFLSLAFVIIAVTAVSTERAHGQMAAMMAQQSKEKDDSAKKAAQMMAALMAAMCNQPQGNVAPCIMAGLAMSQSDKSDQAGQGAGQNAGFLSTGTGGGGSQDSGSAVDKPDGPQAGKPGSGAELAEIRDKLKAAGAEISSDGSSMTLPGGGSIALDSSAATDAGMKSAGLSDQQIAMGKTALADALAKMGSKGKELADNGFGGGGGGGYSPSISADPKSSGKGAPGKKPKVTGLTKNFHGEKIGVAADDIFEMISRRYKAQEAANTFLE